MYRVPKYLSCRERWQVQNLKRIRYNRTMFAATQNMRRIIGGCFLATFLLSFGLVYLNTLKIAEESTAHHTCPFTHTDTITLCNMSPVEHLTAWQEMLAFAPTSTLTALLILALLLGFKHPLPFLKAPKLLKAYTLLQPYCSTSLPKSYLSFLEFLLARGILHPKLF